MNSTANNPSPIYFPGSTQYYSLRTQSDQTLSYGEVLLKIYDYLLRSNNIPMSQPEPFLSQKSISWWQQDIELCKIKKAQHPLLIILQSHNNHKEIAHHLFLLSEAMIDFHQQRSWQSAPAFILYCARIGQHLFIALDYILNASIINNLSTPYQEWQKLIVQLGQHHEMAQMIQHLSSILTSCALKQFYTQLLLKYPYGNLFQSIASEMTININKIAIFRKQIPNLNTKPIKTLCKIRMKVIEKNKDTYQHYNILKDISPIYKLWLSLFN